MEERAMPRHAFIMDGIVAKEADAWEHQRDKARGIWRARIPTRLRSSRSFAFDPKWNEKHNRTLYGSPAWRLFSAVPLLFLFLGRRS
jgi:hypothetical protein